ncbi:MAG TPA: Gfo/Idh/MocA family oxidoreductase [Ignavibacteriales bacterium]|nr:Gfo/Idh/MocA family oxidoreductase [Ignavibacteriales bacterium]HOL81927.1 Gfo/Idh/MocA family oxidoreductase [Ignavibacteriales bacterium]HOM65949.1 Gfo/Idh/MocA family oxidoreductase [Ignavibacteriales bacterium]HPD67481.1 Gfo/Idh/MocA family oxidoreductase [Ignavibacteriales bacterium]HPP34064.1 Gfo/Idh/MocA family oxidoreductase [Ignavibacteriales bacterium]
MKTFIGNFAIKQVNWGIIGCGNYAENTFIPTFQKLKTAKIKAVYSKDNERAKFISQKYSIPEYYNNLDEFLNCNIDAVYISSRNDEHYLHLKEAIKKFKYILCEKPLVLTKEQADEIANLQNQYNSFVFVNLPYLYHPLLNKAKELIDNNFIGKVLKIDVDYLTNYPPNNNYRYDANAGGGPVYDLAPHLLSLVRFLLGDYDLYSSYVGNLIYKQEIEDFASIQLKLQNDAFANITLGFCAKKPLNSIKIIGHEGYIVIDDLVHNRTGKAKMLIQQEGQLKMLFRKKNNNLLLELRDIQRTILNRKEYEPFTFQTSINDVKVIVEILNNAKKI